MDNTNSEPGAPLPGTTQDAPAASPGGAATERVHTLPPGAGQAIGPVPIPSALVLPQRSAPTEPWRPGGGIYGHTAEVRREPLAGGLGTPHAVARPAYVYPVQPAGQTPRRRWPVVLGSVLGGILGAALMVGLLLATGAIGDEEPLAVPTTDQPNVVEITEIVTDTGGSTTAAAVGRKVVPSVVTVEIGNTAADGTFNAFAKGSGVVLSTNGKIVTNDHVVQDADEIRVVLQDGRIYPAQLRGSDALTDLAVVTVDSTDLLPIELGSTADLVIGDTAIAVGNPLGLQGGASLTVGVVSAFDREVTVAEGANGRLYGMLQTDAPITRGSSGGALVDAQGRLMGITTAIGVSDAGAEGIGFAIPVELMTRITDEIVETGDVRHAFLGVSLQNYFEDENGSQIPAGAAITSIEPDTGADAATLDVGDRIIFIDTNPIVTGEDVVNGLRRYRVGDTVKLTVVRDDQTIIVDVVLGERPENLP